MMLVCAGMIGVGKSTLTGILAEHFNTKAFYEEVDNNPILDKFYEDPKKWAFSLQMFFLDKRFKAIKKALSDDNNVLDRSIYEDALFTRINNKQGNISDVDLNIYNSILDNMMEELKELPKKVPDLLIYLEAEFETILEHIRKRGRDYEQVEGNPELLEYYELLWNEYKIWYDEYNYSPKIKIKVETYNPNDKESVDKVIKQIENKLAKVRKEEEKIKRGEVQKMEKQIQKDVNVIKDVLSENGYHWWLLGKVYELLELEEMEKAKPYLQKLLDEEVLVFDDLDSHLQMLIKGDYERAFEEWKEFREEQEEDMINHPSHYNHGDVETISLIGSMLSEEEYYGFAMGNVIKYLDRCEYKENKEQDLLKAQWYAKEAIEFVDDKNSEKLLSYLIAGEFDKALKLWRDTRTKTIKTFKALNFF